MPPTMFTRTLLLRIETLDGNMLPQVLQIAGILAITSIFHIKIAVVAETHTPASYTLHRNHLTAVAHHAGQTLPVRRTRAGTGKPTDCTGRPRVAFACMCGTVCDLAMPGEGVLISSHLDRTV